MRWVAYLPQRLHNDPAITLTLIHKREDYEYYEETGDNSTMKEILENNTIDRLRRSFEENPKHLVAQRATVKNGINDSSIDGETLRSVRHCFSNEVYAGTITNQKQSGRCWMFAALNVLRLEIMKRYNIANVELSQNYPLFWDKLEKANYFLESIMDTVSEPLDGRLVAHLLSAPMQDGGQWDMFANLVRKYGVVPKDAMPESAASSATREMDRYLTLKLREYAMLLRTDAAAGAKTETLRKRKDDMLKTIYDMLCISLGTPPERFDWEARAKDDTFVRVEDVTPLEFYEKCVGLNLDDYVSIINAPTADKPFHRTYTVSYLGNVKGGSPVTYLNLPIEEFKELALSQLKEGEAVWFGCDVGQWHEKKSGVMDTDVLKVDELFSTTFPLTKAERLDYGESCMTHAMVFTGVNLDEFGVPDRWKVENSWGTENGNEGFYVMSDRWFDEYVYQIVVNKKYLSVKQLEELALVPTILAPWDPMGSLA